MCLPGATSGTILKSAKDIPGFKLIQLRIPDICLKGSVHINIRKKCVFRDLIAEFPEMGIKGRPILLPFYPPAYLKCKYYPTTDDINEHTIRANRVLGESTPRLNELVCHPQRSHHQLDNDKLHDGVHPRNSLCRDMEKQIANWVARSEELEERIAYNTVIAGLKLGPKSNSRCFAQ